MTTAIPMRTERLSRLADLLDRHADEGGGPRFDLSEWTDGEIKTSGHLFWKKENLCHTAACAVGLACLSGTFAADGLRYMNGEQIEPLFAGLRNWEAVRAFFGLSAAQAEHLFYEANYPGTTKGPDAEREVARRIRKLIAQKPSRRTRKAVEKIKADALKAVAVP